MHTQPSKLSRRTFLQMAAVTAAPLILAACAPPPPAASTGSAAAPAAPSGEKTTIRFIGMEYDSRLHDDSQDCLMSSTLAKEILLVSLRPSDGRTGHDPLHPNQRWASAGYLQRWRWLVAGVSVSRWYSRRLPTSCLQTCLTKFWKSGLDAMTVKGTLFGMPYFLNPRGMYYRKDLFEEAGLNAPQTFADVAAAAKALHNPPTMYGTGWKMVTTGGMRG